MYFCDPVHVSLTQVTNLFSMAPLLEAPPLLQRVQDTSRTTMAFREQVRQQPSSATRRVEMHPRA